MMNAKAREIIWTLNLAHLLFGVSIFGHELKQSQRYWNKFRGPQIILAFLHRFWVNFATLLRGKISIWTISNLLYYSTELTFFVWIWIYSKRVSSNLNWMARSLKKSQKHVVRIQAIVSSLIIMLGFMSETYITVSEVIRGRHFGSGLLALMKIFDPFFHSLSVYFIFSTMSFYTIRNLLEKLILMANVSDPLLVMEKVRTIQKIMSEANRIAGMSFVPLLIYISVGIPGGISATFIVKNSSNFYGVYDFILVCFYVSLMSSLILYIVVVKHKLEDYRSKVIDRLIFQDKCHEQTNFSWDICINELQSPTLFNFSILSLLILDFKLILSFFGSIISTSVLLIQIEVSLTSSNSTNTRNTE
jgi:hypothetical protein